MKHFFRGLISVFILSSYQAFSWGPQGHRLVALIARSQLEPAVIETIDFYLKGTTWEDAATWMDDIQGNPKYDYMRSWHYVNIPKDKAYVPNKEPNLVNKLEYCIRMLQYRAFQSEESVNETIKTLFHLMGDIHQPLHCGYTEDKEGSDIRLYLVQKETNLHKVWDWEIIHEKKMDIWYCAKVLVGMKLTVRGKEEMEKINVVGWLGETRALLPEVYKFTGNKIDQRYVDVNAIHVETQLIKAGLRLASVLNTYFKA